MNEQTVTRQLPIELVSLNYVPGRNTVPGIGSFTVRGLQADPMRSDRGPLANP